MDDQRKFDEDNESDDQEEDLIIEENIQE